MLNTEATQYLKATLAAFGPGEAINMTQDTWAKLHEAMSVLIDQPKQMEQEPVALKYRLAKIHDALCNDLGDSDPYIDEDMTDEEICEEMPVFWAAKEIADLIGDTPWTQYTSPPAQPAPVSRDAQEAQFESWWESLASKWDGADAKNAAWQAWRAAAELGTAE